MTDLRTEESSNAERSMTEVENQHEEINGEEYEGVRYNLQYLLGSGGYGDVYLAIDVLQSANVENIYKAVKFPKLTSKGQEWDNAKRSYKETEVSKTEIEVNEIREDMRKEYLTFKTMDP